MGAYSTMWAYLWDLVDEGLSDAVRYCREEIGLDALSVATAYHSYQQMRPHRPGPKLLYAGINRQANYRPGRSGRNPGLFQ